jgi:hypothetical protein
MTMGMQAVWLTSPIYSYLLATLYLISLSDPKLFPEEHTLHSIAHKTIICYFVVVVVSFVIVRS